MRFYAIKREQKGAVTRKYDAAREKGGANFKKSDFSLFTPPSLPRIGCQLLKIMLASSPLLPSPRIGCQLLKIMPAQTWL